MKPEVVAMLLERDRDPGHQVLEGRCRQGISSPTEVAVEVVAMLFLETRRSAVIPLPAVNVPALRALSRSLLEPQLLVLNRSRIGPARCGCLPDIAVPIGGRFRLHGLPPATLTQLCPSSVRRYMLISGGI